MNCGLCGAPIMWLPKEEDGYWMHKYSDSQSGYLHCQYPDHTRKVGLDPWMKADPEYHQKTIL